MTEIRGASCCDFDWGWGQLTPLLSRVPSELLFMLTWNAYTSRKRLECSLRRWARPTSRSRLSLVPTPLSPSPLQNRPPLSQLRPYWLKILSSHRQMQPTIKEAHLLRLDRRVRPRRCGCPVLQSTEYRRQHWESFVLAESLSSLQLLFPQRSPWSREEQVYILSLNSPATSLVVRLLIIIDYVMKMMVADDSKETHDDPDMFVRVFCLDPNLLPKVAAPGDIVLFKDVRSERYNNRAACIGRSTQKNYSSAHSLQPKSALCATDQNWPFSAVLNRIGTKHKYTWTNLCLLAFSVDQIWPKGQSIAISVKERSRILALWEFHHTPPVDGPSKNPSLPISPIKPKISRQASNTALLATIPSETVFATIPDALKQEAGRLNVIGQVRKIFHPRESTSFIVFDIF